jgi:hypothetical protein
MSVLSAGGGTAKALFVGNFQPLEDRFAVDIFKMLCIGGLKIAGGNSPTSFVQFVIPAVPSGVHPSKPGLVLTFW